MACLTSGPGTANTSPLLATLAPTPSAQRRADSGSVCSAASHPPATDTGTSGIGAAVDGGADSTAASARADASQHHGSTFIAKAVIDRDDRKADDGNRGRERLMRSI